jgi:high-affinity Fe2+/Pb2+ permease
MEQVLFIVWRESVEAMLVVGILYTWLRSTPEGKRLRRGSRSSTGRVEHQYARKSTGKL